MTTPTMRRNLDDAQRRQTRYSQEHSRAAETFDQAKHQLEQQHFQIAYNKSAVAYCAALDAWRLAYDEESARQSRYTLREIATHIGQMLWHHRESITTLHAGVPGDNPQQALLTNILEVRDLSAVWTDATPAFEYRHILPQCEPPEPYDPHRHHDAFLADLTTHAAEIGRRHGLGSKPFEFNVLEPPDLYDALHQLIQFIRDADNDRYFRGIDPNQSADLEPQWDQQYATRFRPQQEPSFADQFRIRAIEHAITSSSSTTVTHERTQAGVSFVTLAASNITVTAVRLYDAFYTIVSVAGNPRPVIQFWNTLLRIAQRHPHTRMYPYKKISNTPASPLPQTHSQLAKLLLQQHTGNLKVIADAAEQLQQEVHQQCFFQYQDIFRHTQRAADVAGQMLNASTQGRHYLKTDEAHTLVERRHESTKRFRSLYPAHTQRHLTGADPIVQPDTHNLEAILSTTHNQMSLQTGAVWSNAPTELHPLCERVVHAHSPTIECCHASKE